MNTCQELGRFQFPLNYTGKAYSLQPDLLLRFAQCLFAVVLLLTNHTAFCLWQPLQRCVFLNTLALPYSDAIPHLHSGRKAKKGVTNLLGLAPIPPFYNMLASWLAASHFALTTPHHKQLATYVK